MKKNRIVVTLTPKTNRFTNEQGYTMTSNCKNYELPLSCFVSSEEEAEQICLSHNLKEGEYMICVATDWTFGIKI